MSVCINSLRRGWVSLCNKNVQQLLRTSTRQLYTPNSMGVNGYLATKEHVKTQFLNVDQVFFNKMREFIEKEDSLIFTEDLKTMLHLVEKKPEDLDLLYKMIKKFVSQNHLRFGNYVFGTVAMRAFYHLDEPNLALKLFQDPEVQQFFNQLMTYQILLSLLYNHGMYREMRQVYDDVTKKNTHGVSHPRNSLILVSAASYKENTPESFEFLTNVFRDLQGKGYIFPRRAITFFSGLSLNQNNPTTALEIISLSRNSNYIDIRCLKLEAYAALNRVDEITMYLEESLKSDKPFRAKLSYFKDTIAKIEEYAKKNFDENAKIIKLLEQIKLHDFIQDKTLPEHLCSEIDYVKEKNQDHNKAGDSRIVQNRRRRDLQRSRNIV